MKEVLDFHADKISSSNILKKLNLVKNNYFLVSSHREENLDNEKNFQQFANVLFAIEKKYNMTVIVSAHPRLRKKIENSKNFTKSNIIFCKPFSFSQYINLMINSKCVLSDSGTITEEASILNINAINIRDAHERPEGSEEAVCISTGIDVDRILNALECIDTNFANRKNNIVKDYDVSNVSQIILRTIISYISHVNRYSWRKEL